MSKTETLCPSCGHSPIPEWAERCPKCGKAFVDVPDESTVSGTMLGGLTGSLTADPIPCAIALAVGALYFTLRAGGFLTPVGDPPLVFVVAAFDVVAMVLVMTTSGPAKHAPAFVGVLELIAVGLTARAPTLVTMAGAVHGVTLIAMSVAEPGRVRLRLGAGVASAAAVLGVVTMAQGALPRSTPLVTLQDERTGFSLLLPAGWRPANDADVGPHLALARDQGLTVHRGFRRDGPVLVGVLRVSADEQPAQDKACHAALAALGLGEPGPAVVGLPPGALGREALVYELRTPSGAVGRFGCGMVGARLVALAVVSPEPGPGVGAAGFETIAAGLDLRR